ncbi:hypothetical protein SAMN05421664_2842 [Chryseobacterium soldanellicola]|uniref:Lipopolysaccharide biosynthesis protein n=1 Tax=Chryseobacterium soldanellicola TaxID=311333 RepID=A0A1H1E8U2_9FLAO|nr:hypothetical protein [Chryseobacterium soldanellicola]SDQ85182.1 hypothetical protein SAMN05421664_2842 [Chryseobacterium soldanellicola]
MTLKKITLIYPFAYGYIDFVVQELQSNENIQVTDIKTDTIKYTYPNIFVKIRNGITKLFGSNIKKKYFAQQVLQQIKEKQDIIFVIRPDMLEVSLLKELKQNTETFIAYFYDSCKKYPKQLEIAHFFDEIYSYEKEDIEKYHFIETSNFIYDQQIEPEEIKYDIFNVSSYDSRIDEINTVSTQLFEAGFKIYFVLFWFEKLSYPHLISTTEYLSLKETKKLISQSKAMIDIQRQDQKGLSFRTFESLGYRKKLITTNISVKNYDFYHPNNMLVIDSNNLHPDEIKNFLELDDVEISPDIIKKYTVETFTKKIFKL